MALLWGAKACVRSILELDDECWTHARCAYIPVHIHGVDLAGSRCCGEHVSGGPHGRVRPIVGVPDPRTSTGNSHIQDTALARALAWLTLVDGVMALPCNAPVRRRCRNGVHVPIPAQNNAQHLRYLNGQLSRAPRRGEAHKFLSAPHPYAWISPVEVDSKHAGGTLGGGTDDTASPHGRPGP